MLVHQQRETRPRGRHPPDSKGLYRCTVCNKVGGSNQQECFLLGKVKEVVRARSEHIVCCCQVPLGGKRCDVMLMPLHAIAVKQLIVVELDGTDHTEKPRLYGLSRNEAYNTVVESDAEKKRLVTDRGMQFMRVSVSEVARTEWIDNLNAMLDQAKDVN